MIVWFKNLRIQIFNWFAAGRITAKQYEQENPMSTYIVGNAGGSSGVLNINPNGNMAYNPGAAVQTERTMMIKITPATGGMIIQVNTQEYSQGELYIIPEGTDFDRELGKIITMSKLKA